MILVLLGTQHNEFTRLLEEIEQCIKKGLINEKVIVQAGATKYKSDNMEIFDMIPKDILDNLINEASLIITHGGVGSIVMALRKNKKIIAVPRLHKYKEHVNDHQREIIDVFYQKKYLIGIQNVEELASALSKIKDFTPKEYNGNNKNIIRTIEDFIDNI